MKPFRILATCYLLLILFNANVQAQSEQDTNRVQTIELSFIQPDGLRLETEKPEVDILKDSVVNLFQNFEALGGVQPYEYFLTYDDTTINVVGNEISVSPEDSTTYQLTVYDANGCSADAFVNVNVVYPLEVSFTKSDSICYGTNNGFVELSVSNGAPPYQFMWNNEEAGSQITDLAAGQYNVTVTDSMEQSIQLEFTITELDEIHSNISASICSGESFQIGTNNYAESGQYIDTLISVAGCDSIVFLDLHVSAFDIDTLFAEICDGESYEYYGDQFMQEGSYPHTFQSSDGCDSLELWLFLDVLETPYVPDIQFAGDTLYSSADNNQWYLNDELIEGATNQSYVIDTSGNYHVVAFNDSGCSASSEVYALTFSSVPDQEYSEFKCLVYPNPNNGLFTLKVVNNKHTGVATIQLFTVDGKQVNAQDFEINKAVNEKQLEYHHLIPGIYYLQLISGKNIARQKVIIQ